MKFRWCTYVSICVSICIEDDILHVDFICMYVMYVCMYVCNFREVEEPAVKVSNLPADVTKGQIQELFKAFGMCVCTYVCIVCISDFCFLYW